MKKLLVYLKDFKKESILAPLFKMLEASFELLVPLVVAAMIICAFLAGIVIGPSLGSTECEFGEVELGEMLPGTKAADDLITYETAINGK